MNRIFKTVWNVARKALVVASEKAGIGQSRCAARGGGAHFAAAVNGLAVNKKSLAVADACSDTILRRGERVRTGASKVRAGTVNR